MATLYDSLDVGSYEVRFLAFVPNLLELETEYRVECTLEKYSLVHDPPRYVALSYCWGDQNARRDITVNGQVVSVTANLAEALWHLHRTIGNDVVVWVDALCINQGDTQERSLQVRLMKQIFERAETVCAWLGVPENGEDPYSAFTEIEALGSSLVGDPRYSNSSLPVNQPNTPPFVFTCMLSVFQCELWRRRWVIQELAVASQIKIMYGSCSMTWDSFCVACAICSKSKLWTDTHRVFATHFNQLRELRVKYQNGTPLSLCETLINTYSWFTDPRDSIFALIGITSDGPTLVPAPNYFQHPAAVSASLTRALFHKTKNLNLLTAGEWFKERSDSLPTWSPDWCSRVTDVVAAPTPSKCPGMVTLDRVYRDDNVLTVHGTIIGRITALTASFNSYGSPAYVTSGPENFVATYSSKYYYHSSKAVAQAVATLFVKSPGTGVSLRYKRPFLHHRLQHATDAGHHLKLWLFEVVARRRLNLFTNITIWRYDQWRKANNDFRIDGLPVHDYFHPAYACNWFNVGLAVLFFLNLCCLALFPAMFYFNLPMTDKLWWLNETVYTLWVCISAIGASAGLTHFSYIFPEVSGVLTALLTGSLTLYDFSSQIRYLIIVCGAAFSRWLYDYGLIFMWFWHGLLGRREFIKMAMRTANRLCVLDQGMLGVVAGHRCRPNDYVCSIAGRSSLIVLRRHDVDGLERYRVVGSAAVQFNEQDTERYEEFPINDQGNIPIFSHMVWTRWGPRIRKTKVKTDEELLQSCRQQDWWRSFELI